MVRDIVKDTFILSRISVLANKDDLSIAQDLIDTLEEACVPIWESEAYGS